MTTAYLVTIIDGADFNRTLRQRVFTNPDRAYDQGQAIVFALQCERREKGETDELFIEAIHADIDLINLDEDWPE